MKKTYLILVFITAGLISYSQSPDSIRDSKSYKLSYNEFQNLYGTDDTSAALIDLFFSKRDEKAFGQMTMLPLSTGVTLVMPPVGIYLMAVSTPIFVNGLIVQSKYSRKKLLVALNDYHENKLLSDSHQKKVTALLELNAENQAEELKLTQLEILKAGVNKNYLTRN